MSDKKFYSTYPIVVFEDRYGGVYSGGAWIAVANGDRLSRLEELLDGTHGGDIEAASFGVKLAAMDDVAVGETADKAVGALKAKNGDSR